MLAAFLAAALLPQSDGTDPAVQRALPELARFGLDVDPSRLRVDRVDTETFLFAAREMSMKPHVSRGLWGLLTASGVEVGDERSFVESIREEAGLGLVALYLPSQTCLILDSERLQGPQAELFLIHELVHAAQDQRAPLPFEELDSLERFFQLRLAIEGEAQLASNAALLVRMGGSTDTITEDDKGYVTPDLWREGGIILHYAIAMETAVDAWRSGGWEAVRELTRAETSTEELIHRAKRGRDRSRLVELPEPVFPQDSQAKLTHGGVVGQLGLYFILRNYWRVPVSKAWPSVVGWDGDRLHVWSTSSGLVVAFRSVWDRELDARQFESVLRTMARGRVERRGAVVEWSFAEDATLRRAVEDAFARAPLEAESVAADARTTAEAELAWLDENGAGLKLVWVHPDTDLELPVPAGWSAEENELGVMLMRESTGEFRDNVNVRATRLSDDAPLEKILSIYAEKLPGVHGDGFRGTARERIGKREVLVSQFVGDSHPGFPLRHVQASTLRGQELITVTWTVLEKRFEAIEPEIQWMIQGLRFRRN